MTALLKKAQAGLRNRNQQDKISAAQNLAGNLQTKSVKLSVWSLTQFLSGPANAAALRRR